MFLRLSGTGLGLCKRSISGAYEWGKDEIDADKLKKMDERVDKMYAFEQNSDDGTSLLTTDLGPRF